MNSAVARSASAQPQHRTWNIIEAAAETIDNLCHRRASAQRRIAHTFDRLATAGLSGRLRPEAVR